MLTLAKPGVTLLTNIRATNLKPQNSPSNELKFQWEPELTDKQITLNYKTVNINQNLGPTSPSTPEVEPAV